MQKIILLYLWKSCEIMIYSMTGYGKSSFVLGERKLTIEIRALNSKTLDLNFRLPAMYRSKEIELRKLFSEQVNRGKIDVFFNFESSESGSYNINSGIVQSYINELRNFETNEKDLLAIAMRLPEVLQANDTEISEEEWNELKNCTENAIADFNTFRKKEGLALKDEFFSLSQKIRLQLVDLQKYEQERIDKIKDKLEAQLKEISLDYDTQRFHQELLYYIEKLDISEEKTRLEHHLQFFEETLSSTEIFVGKKLGFIAQEIGREINTIGSKANNQSIQKCVVLMKDELEKIKEQTFNIL